MAITYVGDWHMHDHFVQVNAENVRRAQEQLPDTVRSSARIVFTAHSIPVSMPGARRYHAQLLATADLVAARAGARDWTLVFQSRSGRPEDPWLGPDVCDYLREERKGGLRAAVIAPIGFLCDHIEVLWDLDQEAAAASREIGLPISRAATVNDHPLFLDMMADVVRDTWSRYERGVPLTLTSA